MHLFDRKDFLVMWTLCSFCSKWHSTNEMFDRGTNFASCLIWCFLLCIEHLWLFGLLLCPATIGQRH